MKYLLSTTETYRVDDENEAIALIENAKANNTVSKYNCLHKERKQKGEVLDSWYRVTITKIWNEEKEPIDGVTVDYKRESAF